MVRSKGNIRFFLYVAFLIVMSSAFYECKRKDNRIEQRENISKSDTLKVVTLYGPLSFFDYRGEKMGIDYENILKFAEEEGLEVTVTPMKNIGELVTALKEGEADIAAYPVPIISEYKEDLIYCGPREISNQVLVQKKGNELLSDVTELVGKNIHVENNSKYLYRLENLNLELGGGLKILPSENDTVTSEDLLRQVSTGEIGYTVIDSETARLYQSAYPNLDFSMAISSDQASSWAVGTGMDSIAIKIDQWENRTHSSEFLKEIYKSYYDKALKLDFDSKLTYFKNKKLEKGGPVSAYDEFFKKYASVAGFDWELLAAIAYCESRYTPDISSRFGAYGLMQVMPSSARAMGIDPGSLGLPEQNVLAGARIIKSLNDALKNKVEDPEERMKFVLAGYNSGLGHIYDAMAIAEKIGLDPQKWNANVSVCALLKSRPAYYNDPVVKHGYFRGRETVDFVEHVSEIYRYLKDTLPSNQKKT